MELPDGDIEVDTGPLSSSHVDLTPAVEGWRRTGIVTLLGMSSQLVSLYQISKFFTKLTPSPEYEIKHRGMKLRTTALQLIEKILSMRC